MVRCQVGWPFDVQAAEQPLHVLARAGGRVLPQIAVLKSVNSLSVSKATFFKWRDKYGGATVSDVKRLRELEEDAS